MIEPRKKIRQTLFHIHPLSYRIKQSTPSQDIVNKKLFIEILESLKKIEDRREFMEEEIGMDMTIYEDEFFHVIENLFQLAFSKKQIALIRVYIYELKSTDEDWDGTIVIEVSKNKELTVQFKTPNDVWEAIQKVA